MGMGSLGHYSVSTSVDKLGIGEPTIVIYPSLIHNFADMRQASHPSALDAAVYCQTADYLP
jgi:hypothetical protein